MLRVLWAPSLRSRETIRPRIRSAAAHQIAEKRISLVPEAVSQPYSVRELANGFIHEKTSQKSGGVIEHGRRPLRDLGTTILLVEQQVHQALKIADRAYVLENGKIILHGVGKDLLSEERVKKAYLDLT